MKVFFSWLLLLLLLLGTAESSLRKIRGGAGDLGSWRGTATTQPAWTASSKGLQQGPPRRSEQEHFKVEEIVQPLDDFLDRTSRNVFLRRVYGLLSASLGLSAASCLLFAAFPGLFTELIRSPLGLTLIGGSAITGALTPLAISFIPAFRSGKKAISLFWVFSFAQALTLGVVTSAYDAGNVVLAMFQTLAATLALTAFGFQPNPNFDLTGLGSVLVSVLFISLVSGLLGSIFRIPAMNVLQSSFGALLFAAFIVYDTQLIVGGKHKKRQLDTQDYVLGAMILYIDIINLFIRLLQLMDNNNSSSSDD